MGRHFSRLDHEQKGKKDGSGGGRGSRGRNNIAKLGMVTSS